MHLEYIEINTFCYTIIYLLIVLAKKKNFFDL